MPNTTKNIGVQQQRKPLQGEQRHGRGFEGLASAGSQDGRYTLIVAAEENMLMVHEDTAEKELRLSEVRSEEFFQ